MNMAGLSLDQAPPFASVARFFITAPIFGVLFSIFLAVAGDGIFDRFSAQTIGIIHLFTIGFVLMTIFGAMAQMLPVLAGLKIANFQTVGRFSHLLLTVGTLCFFISFYFYISVLKFVALALLASAALLYMVPLLYEMFRAKITNFTVRGMMLSALFGFLGILFGAHLLSSHATTNLLPSHITFVSLHLVLSVFGFAALLIVSVAHQVLPMFYVAPSFNPFCKKFVYIFAASLFVFIALSFMKVDAGIAIKIVTATFLGAFATVALKKIGERRRKITDVSLKYWQTGLGFLIAGSDLLLTSIFVEIENIAYLYGVIFGIGFLGSIIKAMLNKIVPFLVWFHLTSEGNFDAPNINDLLPQERARREFWLSGAALAALCIGYFVPMFITLGGAILAVSFALLAKNMKIAASNYAQLSINSIRQTKVDTH